jgi:NadR type nicotinamide-nucleotide adenylyltransferase
LIRVVVTGSECTGKTTLAAALAERFDAPWVPEYARRFVAEKGAAPSLADVDAIARGQIALEEEAAGAGAELIVQDTDLLSTVVYSHHYWGECPSWVEDALSQRQAHLYLLADIDVPWAPDGLLRDRGDRRDEMQSLFRDALVERSLPWIGVSGGASRRLDTAADAIVRLLRASAPSLRASDRGRP